jgi:hypothetical protein
MMVTPELVAQVMVIAGPPDFLHFILWSQGGARQACWPLRHDICKHQGKGVSHAAN